MTAEVIPLLPRRRVEAEILSRVFHTLRARVGDEAALEVIRTAVESAAEEAGRAFARQAPGAPTLAHFATVVERWREGNALDVEGPRLSGDVLEFTVTRCGYVELYRSAGLPRELAYALSCARDAAFARGYCAGLRMERSATIAEGSPVCRFRFVWEAPRPA